MTKDDPLFEFPCEFPIKAMGRGIIGLEATVLDIVKRHVDKQDVLSVTSKSSKNAKYISVTININARSRQQLDAIYMDLTASPEVLVAL